MSEQISNEVLAERLKGVSGDVTEIKRDIKSLTATINTLVAIEKRQSDQADAIRDHELRLKIIETSMPGLKEARAWVVAAILGIVVAVSVLGWTVITRTPIRMEQQPL